MRGGATVPLPERRIPIRVCRGVVLPVGAGKHRLFGRWRHAPGERRRFALRHCPAEGLESDGCVFGFRKVLILLYLTGMVDVLWRGSERGVVVAFPDGFVIHFQEGRRRICRQEMQDIPFLLA